MRITSENFADLSQQLSKISPSLRSCVVSGLESKQWVDFFNALHTTPLTRLIIDDSALDEEALEALTSLLKTNAGLVELTLRRVKMSTTDSFINALATHRTLHSLSLVKTLLTSTKGALALEKIVENHHSLRNLFILETSIPARWWQPLIRGLVKNQTITVLRLSLLGLDCSNESASDFTRQIQSNSSVIFMDLGSESVTRKLTGVRDMMLKNQASAVTVVSKRIDQAKKAVAADEWLRVIQLFSDLSAYSFMTSYQHCLSEIQYFGFCRIFAQALQLQAQAIEAYLIKGEPRPDPFLSACYRNLATQNLETCRHLLSGVAGRISASPRVTLFARGATDHSSYTPDGSDSWSEPGSCADGCPSTRIQSK